MKYKNAPFGISTKIISNIDTVFTIPPTLEVIGYQFEYIVWNTGYATGRSKRNYCVFRQ